jgi:transposase InsO family protein
VVPEASRQVVAGLTHHSDRGVRYRAIRYAERLAEAEAVASVGSKGDSYDNAMAEAFGPCPRILDTGCVRLRGFRKGSHELVLVGVRG